MIFHIYYFIIILIIIIIIIIVIIIIIIIIITARLTRTRCLHRGGLLAHDNLVDVVDQEDQELVCVLSIVRSCLLEFLFLSG